VETEEEANDLKQKIEGKLDTPINSQKIIYRGIALTDNFSLSHCIFNKNTHNIIIKFCGY
jgi:hypothetical protein